MEAMEEIKMYKCRYCGKIFYTKDKHKCKFNPSFKNCFSCRHVTNVVEKTVVVWDSFFNREIKETIKNMQCDCLPETSILDLSNRHWQMDCKKWQLMEEYEGKRTYVRKVMKNRLSLDQERRGDEDEEDPYLSYLWGSFKS